MAPQADNATRKVACQKKCRGHHLRCVRVGPQGAHAPLAQVGLLNERDRGQDGAGRVLGFHAPLAQVGFLDEPDRGEDRANIVQAALNRDLRLPALGRRHVRANERARRLRQRDRALRVRVPRQKTPHDKKWWPVALTGAEGGFEACRWKT